MSQLRTFIAVSISPSRELRCAIAAMGDMGAAVKPVAADNLHVTLKFLGDTPSERVPEIVAVTRDVAAAHERFELQLAGLDAFPRVERPSVVWVGIEGGEPLTAMAAELEGRLEQLGFEKERRGFTPHLTVARVRRKPPPTLFALFEQYAATNFGTTTVDRLTYYRSDLQSGTPVYSVLGTGELNQ
ncbi:MAG: RNA 2',3'-cyclic phosphodiesterase [Planctomycetaceae bacterium]